MTICRTNSQVSAGQSRRSQQVPGDQRFQLPAKDSLPSSTSLAVSNAGALKRSHAMGLIPGHQWACVDIKLNRFAELNQVNSP
jgi:hypothetical protein